MDDILEYLEKIRKNPALFFGGRRTLNDLGIFIETFILGRQGTNKEIKLEENFIRYGENSFQNFVAKRYERVTTTNSLYRIIEYNTGSEESAYELFFKLLDEYLANRE